MPTQDIINVATQIAVVFGVILAVVAMVLLFVELRKRILTPGLQAVFHALEPFALQAIYSAEAIATKLYDDAKTRLDGVDKHQLAVDTYATLPDAIWVAGRRIPIGIIKALVTKDAWAAFVQNVFEKADAQLSRNEAWLIKQLGDLAHEVDEADGQVTHPAN